MWINKRMKTNIWLGAHTLQMFLAPTYVKMPATAKSLYMKQILLFIIKWLNVKQKVYKLRLHYLS